ncbi:MAG: hypothetical protein ACKO47_02315, partial [Alphaproteobacteria bacterium]
MPTNRLHPSSLKFNPYKLTTMEMNIRHGLSKYRAIEGGSEAGKTLDPFMSMVSRLVGKGGNEGFHGQSISNPYTPKGLENYSLIGESSHQDTPMGLESYSLFDDQSPRSDRGRLSIEELEETPEITRGGFNDHSPSLVYEESTRKSPLKSPRELTPKDILALLKKIDLKKLSEENESNVLDNLILNSDPEVFSDCLDEVLRSLREKKSKIGPGHFSPEKKVLSYVEEEFGGEFGRSTSFLIENSDDSFNEQSSELKASIIASQALCEIESIESIGKIKGSEVSLEEEVIKELAEIKSNFIKLAFLAWQSVLMQKSVDYLEAMSEHDRSKLIENLRFGNSSLEGANALTKDEDEIRKDQSSRKPMSTTTHVMVRSVVDSVPSLKDRIKALLSQKEYSVNGGSISPSKLTDSRKRPFQGQLRDEGQSLTAEILSPRSDIHMVTKRGEAIKSPRGETGLFRRFARNMASMISPRLGNPAISDKNVSPRIHDEGKPLYGRNDGQTQNSSRPSPYEPYGGRPSLSGRQNWPLHDGPRILSQPMNGVPGLNLSGIPKSPRSKTSVWSRAFSFLTPRSGRSNSDRSSSSGQMDSNRSSTGSITIYGGGFGGQGSLQKENVDESSKPPILSSQLVFQAPDESSGSASPSSTMFADEQGDDSLRAMKDGSCYENDQGGGDSSRAEVSVSPREKSQRVPNLVKKFERAKDGSHVVNERFNSLAPRGSVCLNDNDYEEKAVATGALVFPRGLCSPHPKSNPQPKDPHPESEAQSTEQTRPTTPANKVEITGNPHENDQVAPTGDNWVYKKLKQDDELYDVYDKHKEKTQGYDQDLKLRYSKNEESSEQQIENSIIGAIENLAKDNSKLDKEKLKRFLTYLIIANKIGGIANRQDEFIEEIKKINSQGIEKINSQGLDFKEAKKFSSD